MVNSVLASWRYLGGMGGFKSLALMLAVLTATAAGVVPARGQCRLCETPSTAVPMPAPAEGIALEIETSLDFDRLILAGGGHGMAVIRPDGSAAAHGGLEQLSGRVMVGTAVVRGTAGRAIRVELPRQIELHSRNGGRIALDDIVSDLPPAPRLDSAGRLSFRFGGRVTVTADSEGDYRGELPITVEYQ